MRGEETDKARHGLLIEYRELGTIHVDELAQALIADINALKDIYNIQYVKAAHLRLPVTNEYGEPLQVTRPGGGRLFKIDTHHFTPTCKDYEL